jgi:hypothetical protein
MTAPDYAPLFVWVTEREAMRIRKDNGAPPPFSAAPILATYRFCNVRREDDRVTVWIRQNIRERFAGHEHLWLMLCIARQINWPDTLKVLIDDTELAAWPDRSNFDPRNITHVLNVRKDFGEKIYTGAYMISAPSTKGANKQQYIAETVIGALWRRRQSFGNIWIALAGDSTRRVTPSLQRIHSWISESNGWGAFMAYQAVVDMRFTSILCDAPDVASWAAAGPGTLRGLNRLHGRPVDAALSQDRALREMRAIYQVVSPETGVAMDFSDVPNILCETDKYLRVKNGEGKPRALYVPGRGS